ncbi:MAG: hypothetical protein M1423_06795 [Acidobacteria bacterium]|nr:hypothetical protein [Acidobacteriota bacterium]
MKFSDLFKPKTGPEALVRLALFPFLVLVVGSLVMGVVSNLSNSGILLLMLLCIVISPLAYALREQRRGHRRSPRARRSAERTPLMPREEEEEE